MDSESKPGGITLRISGKLFDIDHVIELVEKNPVTPTQSTKAFAGFLFMVLIITMHFLGNEEGQIGYAVLAVFIHEFGHFLGLRFTGSPNASFDFGVLGPFVSGDEGVSAGRKALVALFGPAFGLAVAAVLAVIGHFTSSEVLFSIVKMLVFISALNLIPTKPFDGYAVLEHLIFNRFPKLQIGYLVGCGVFLFFMYAASFYRYDHPFYAFFFMGLCWASFLGFKKMDNMAGMIVRLRGRDVDFAEGRYQPKTIKNMVFSLSVFDFVSESDLALFLRELWDKAWELPATRTEMINVLAMYFLMLAGCAASPVCQKIFLSFM
jgi:Zn-dependent protease